MYVVGSKVVHPCHGAGTIVRIRNKSIGETRHAYYVIDTVSSTRSTRLMVPVLRAESLGLRHVGKPSRLRKVLASCRVAPEEAKIDNDYKSRQNTMREKLKSGRFEEVTFAVRTLFFMNNRRPLGVTDRRLFDSGKDILASELAVASGLEMSEAVREVEDNLDKMLPTVRLRQMLGSCSPPEEGENETDPHTRQKNMREQLASGCFEKVVSVVGVLSCMNSRKALGMIDRCLLNQAKEMLVRYLAVASGLGMPAAKQEAEESLARMLNAGQE